MSDVAREWQPIATVPHQRGAILVWCAERRNTYTAIWTDNGYEEPHWEHFGGGRNHLQEEPTHWMPLPAPPELSAAQANAQGGG